MNYNTKQRQIILDFLKKSNSTHITVDEISAELVKSNSPVGKATVYRYLEKLVLEGLVRKYQMPEGKSACFQYISGKETCAEHFHLKCDSCGELFHMECDFLTNVNGHIYEDHNFIINSSKTVFYGVCEKCRDQSGISV